MISSVIGIGSLLCFTGKYFLSMFGLKKSFFVFLDLIRFWIVQGIWDRNHVTIMWSKWSIFQSRHLCVLFYWNQMEKYFELWNHESFDELHRTLGPYVFFEFIERFSNFDMLSNWCSRLALWLIWIWSDDLIGLWCHQISIILKAQFECIMNHNLWFLNIF